VVRNSGGALTMSVDRGTAKDISSWAAAIVVGDNGSLIETDDIIDVTVSYGTSGTKTYSTTLGTMNGNSAARQAAALALLRAVVGRRLLDAGVYAAVDEARALLVTSPAPAATSRRTVSILR
jgi:hypothetical protein